MKAIVIGLLTALLIFFQSNICYAMNSWFDIEDLDANKNIYEIYDNMEISAVEHPNLNISFSCFDINEKGECVLGYTSDEMAYILVFNNDFEYLYGFSSKCSGAIGVQWDGSNIIMYRVRSDLAVSFDKHGEMVELKKISDTTNNNSSYSRVLYSNRRQVGNTVYKAEKSSFFSYNYSKIIKTDGIDEIILFDNSKTDLIFNLFLFSLFIIPFVIVIVLVIIRLKPRRTGGGFLSSR